MVSEKEAAGIRRFVCGQLRDEADLSTLTLGILKKKYQAHNKCDSLSPEVKTLMKQVVQEELMKMQVYLTISRLQFKYIFFVNYTIMSFCGLIMTESEAQEDNKTESEESSTDEENAKSQADGEEQEVKKSQRKRNENRQIDSDESSDEELSESERNEKESNCSDSPKKMVRKNVETRTSSKDEGRKTPLSDAENESDGDCKSETSDESSDSEKGDHAKKNNYLLRLSIKISFSFHTLFVLGFILQSDDKSVARLKRYIALCGVRRNYKKLLEDCRSIRSQVAVLKKELEELGVHGQPTIQKCKKVRMKREQAQELAALDVNNIITTQGRPTRRGASASQKQQDCPSSEYQRTLNSESDSDQENNTHRGRRKMSEWANLQGIISDDADSD
uniref:HIRA interacting protein 3 n=1 Tax=Neolamprologus brichardi TaxID=32507 RepID=A0A3Q4H0E5_NEOBR